MAQVYERATERLILGKDSIPEIRQKRHVEDTDRGCSMEFCRQADKRGVH